MNEDSVAIQAAKKMAKIFLPLVEQHKEIFEKFGTATYMEMQDFEKWVLEKFPKAHAILKNTRPGQGPPPSSSG